MLTSEIHYTFVRLEVFSVSCIPVNTLFKNFSCWYIKPVHRYHNERRNWIILYFLSHVWPTIITDIFLKESLWKSQDFHLNNTMYRYTWLDFHLNNTVHDMNDIIIENCRWYTRSTPKFSYQVLLAQHRFKKKLIGFFLRKSFLWHLSKFL
jgi:hypothetical protein